jgi:hypothetical protein
MPRVRRPSFARTTFLVTLTAILVLLNGAWFFILSFSTWRGILSAWLLEIIGFALAYDCAELLLLVLRPEAELCALDHLDRYPRVALVCCTCDNVDERVMVALGKQTYPNLQIFVLDDSQKTEMQDLINRLPYTVMRRGTRAGYKAGNLNHWLRRHGRAFDYFVIADADSMFPPTFVGDMMRYLEHPANANIAALESCVRPWNAPNTFARLLAPAAVVSRLASLRVASPLGATLSIGHNNLVRTRAVLDIGGFDERYVAEDYATTVALLRTGRWTCDVADVMSFDRVPENLAEYAQRQARWAFQTFQLFTLDGRGLSWIVKLKLLRAMLYYAEPLLMLALLVGLAVWSVGDADIRAAWSSGTSYATAVMPTGLVALACVYLTPLGIRIGVMLRHGVSLRDALRSTLLNAALVCGTAWPIGQRLLSELRGRRPGFDVTKQAEAPSLRQIIVMGLPTYLCAWSIGLAVSATPVMPLWNLLWAVPGVLSPYVIERYQRGRN